MSTASSGSTSSSSAGTGSGPASRGPRDGRSAPRGGGSRWASLVPLGIVVLGLLELAILIAIGMQWSLWWAVLVVVIGWIIGVALVVTAGQQSFVRLRSLIRAVRGSGDVQDHLSRPAFTLLAAACFFFPGLVTDVIGLILLLVPVQRRTVRAMGLAGGSEAARTALRRGGSGGGGVIDGEIIIDGGSSGAERPRPGSSTPPTISPETRD